MSPELRDARQAPFFYVPVAVALVLRATFSGKRLTTARAIYDALSELANEARSSEFKAARERVAAYAGVTDRTVDAYGRRFAQLGLLEVVQRAGAANIWRLIEPPAVAARGEASRRGEANGTTGAKPSAARGEASGTRLKKNGYQEGKKVVPLRESAASGRRDLSRFDEVVKR